MIFTKLTERIISIDADSDYFDAAVVLVTKFSTLFRLPLFILFYVCFPIRHFEV